MTEIIAFITVLITFSSIASFIAFFLEWEEYGVKQAWPHLVVCFVQVLAIYLIMLAFPEIIEPRPI